MVGRGKRKWNWTQCLGQDFQVHSDILERCRVPSNKLLGRDLGQGSSLVNCTCLSRFSRRIYKTLQVCGIRFGCPLNTLGDEHSSALSRRENPARQREAIEPKSSKEDQISLPLNECLYCWPCCASLRSAPPHVGRGQSTCNAWHGG